MKIEMIEGMIANKLELSGMKNEGVEGQCRSLLYHLYTAVELYRLMVPAEKQIAKEWHDVFAKDFRVNLFLKELKSKKNKEKTAPAPHRKEKTIKENSQKTTHTTEGGASLLETRQKAFWDACLKFEPEYDRQLLLKFYCYWAEQVNGTELMLWETKKSWNMRLRLKAWSKKSYQLDDKAADIHLERVKGKKSAPAAVNAQNSEAQKQIAAEREAADIQREEATAKAKADSITMEEYIKKNPNSILRTLKKNDR